MRLLVVGAGGHAKVVVDAAQAAGIDVVGAIGEPQGRTHILGVPVYPTAEGLDADSFIVGVGENRTRAALYAEYLMTGMRPIAVVHPSAIIASGVRIGSGAFIAAGVVVNADTHLGANAILNTSCTVDHDCVVGDHAHIGPTCGLCGGVNIGTGALIGVGCSIIPQRSVGEWAVVGAGAVVVRDIPADELHAGVPARPIKSTEE